MQILSLREARDTCLHFPKQYNVISIAGRMVDVVDPYFCKNQLELYFDDIASKREGCVMPRREHIEEAIEFAKKFPVDIIHCMAGVSRSTGIAYAIFLSQGFSKLEAMEKVLEIRSFARPNARIVYIADRMFLKNK